MAIGKASVVRTVNRFDRNADAGSAGESRIRKVTEGKADEARPVALNQLGDGKLSFRMVVRIKQWQARARRRPVPKGKVFVEKLVHLATWHAPDFGPQTGLKEPVDPIQQRWIELSDADYANQVNETRKRVRQIRKDREFLETCYDLLDSNQDGKLAPEEIEHWAALLLADRSFVALDKPNCALKYWMGRNECGRLTDAERFDLQARLGKKQYPRERLQYDWQDFLLVTLDFYTLAGTLAMHRTFCRLLAPFDGESSDQPCATEPPPVALPRPPAKLLRHQCAVIQAGSWTQRVGAREVSGLKHRPPRLPLPPVRVDMLGPLRPRQPLRATTPVTTSVPETTNRPLRAPQTLAPLCEQGRAQESAPAPQPPPATSPSADAGQVATAWSQYDVDSYGHVLGYVGPAMQKTVNERVNLGVMPRGLRQLSVETARSARRVTLDLRAVRTSDLGAPANPSFEKGQIKYGWQNNLPVVIIPGLCSSGLEVKKSDVSPAWEGERVWFSLEKLGGQRSATTRAAAKTVGLAAEVAAAPVKLVGHVIAHHGKLDTIGTHFMRFHLHRARDLIAADVDGQSDPVARVELLNGEGDVVDKTESSIKNNTRNPFWDESFDLGLHVLMDDIHAVRITLLDDDGIFSKRDHLGETIIELQHNLSSAGFRALPRAWHKLHDTRVRDRRTGFTKDILDSLAEVSRVVGSHSKATFGGEIECWADVISVDRASESSELDSECDSGREPGTPTPGTLLRSPTLVQEAALTMIDVTARATAAALDGAVSAIGVMSKPALEVGDSLKTMSGRPTENDDTSPRSRLTQVDAAQLQGLDTQLWLRHMMLAPDAHSDPPGIKVRAVPGLSGVDYLQPGAVMQATTWVFGPVIKFLMSGGYDESNLKGAPYDWRMPPMYLEKRDNYFSELCTTIVEMYHDNRNKPVVLLAHSMGNNTAHYFTNWVLNNSDKVQQVERAGATKSNGEAWLDKYVYSLFGIGGPYLGACEALRSCITGDDMGIGPALLPAEHARKLCHHMGSGAWLLPAGRLAEEQPVAYDSVERKTETSVRLADGVASGHFEPRTVDEALRRHAAEHVAEQKQQWYGRDPCLPGGSSMMPPPVKRVFHVYGTNLDTQVGFVFKHEEGTHELDTSVNFGRVDGMRYHHGIIWETNDTSQRALRDDTFTEDARRPPETTQIRRVSGDGTVPYTSLQHTLSWNSPRCLSQVVELDRAEHREILADGRFHQVLGDYLCDTLVVYVIAARNLAAKDLLSRSSDPYCIVTLHSSPTNPQRRTKTHKHTLNPEFNEAFTFGSGQPGHVSGDVLASARVVTVEVRDSDLGGLTSDHIGKMALPFQTIVESPTHAVNGWFKLLPDDHADDPDLASNAAHLCNGEIFVHFELESAGQSFRGVSDHLEIVHENMRSYETDTNGAH